jgi:hypothetical protein
VVQLDDIIRRVADEAIDVLIFLGGTWPPGAKWRLLVAEALLDREQLHIGLERLPPAAGIPNRPSATFASARCYALSASFLFGYVSAEHSRSLRSR